MKKVKIIITTESRLLDSAAYASDLNSTTSKRTTEKVGYLNAQVTGEARGKCLKTNSNKNAKARQEGVLTTN